MQHSKDCKLNASTKKNYYLHHFKRKHSSLAFEWKDVIMLVQKDISIWHRPLTVDKVGLYVKCGSCHRYHLILVSQLLFFASVAIPLFSGSIILFLQLWKWHSSPVFSTRPNELFPQFIILQNFDMKIIVMTYNYILHKVRINRGSLQTPDRYSSTLQVSSQFSHILAPMFFCSQEWFLEEYQVLSKI